MRRLKDGVSTLNLPLVTECKEAVITSKTGSEIEQVPAKPRTKKIGYDVQEMKKMDLLRLLVSAQIILRKSA